VDKASTLFGNCLREGLERENKPSENKTSIFGNCLREGLERENKPREKASIFGSRLQQKNDPSNKLSVDEASTLFGNYLREGLERENKPSENKTSIFGSSL
jgi:hypothetical protein